MTAKLTTETIAAIAAWRERCEADGLVTHSTIAKAVGVSVSSARKYSLAMGWRASREAAHLRRNTGRLAAAAKWLREAEPLPPAAAPVSIWQFAAGKAIATVRQGGRHVEVSA